MRNFLFVDMDRFFRNISSFSSRFGGKPLLNPPAHTKPHNFGMRPQLKPDAFSKKFPNQNFLIFSKNTSRPRKFWSLKPT